MKVTPSASINWMPALR